MILIKACLSSIVIYWKSFFIALILLITKGIKDSKQILIDKMCWKNQCKEVT